jgi:hypothetical protein
MLYRRVELGGDFWMKRNGVHTCCVEFTEFHENVPGSLQIKLGRAESEVIYS